jgi:hypothetical protein
MQNLYCETDLYYEALIITCTDNPDQQLHCIREMYREVMRKAFKQGSSVPALSKLLEACLALTPRETGPRLKQQLITNFLLAFG